MTAPLRVGVIGLGVISRFYLAALRDSATMRPVAVCDNDTTALAAVCGGDTPGYTDHVRLLEETRPDAVVVTAPNDVHVQICADAIEHGVGVCVEKPLALDTAQGAALADLAARREVPLLTAFHRRYNSAVARLRVQCAGSRIEALTVRYLERIEEHAGADTWYLDARRCGGGCVADNGPNAFDLIHLLVGPAEVRSARITRDTLGTDRQAEIALRTETARVRVLLDWSYSGERKDIDVRLDDGRTLHADLLAGHTGVKGSLWHEYAQVLRAFERRIRGGTAEPDNGLPALRFVEEVYRLETTVSGKGAG